MWTHGISPETIMMLWSLEQGRYRRDGMPVKAREDVVRIDDEDQRRAVLHFLL
jgi:hypothetical protein